MAGRVAERITKWGTSAKHPAPRGSDNGHYGAHSLALPHEIRTWCGVEKGAVTKKEKFSYTKYIKGKRAFNIDRQQRNGVDHEESSGAKRKQKTHAYRVWVD